MKLPKVSPLFIMAIVIVVPVLLALILQTVYMQKLVAMYGKAAVSSAPVVTTVKAPEPTPEEVASPAPSPKSEKVGSHKATDSAKVVKE